MAGKHITEANAATAKALNLKLGFGLNVKHFGAVGDGITDDSVAVQACIDSLRGIGGKIHFPKGTYLIGSKISILNDISTWPKQAPLIITGEGCHKSGMGTEPLGGTILLMTFNGTYGKLVTSGLGYLVLQDITFQDNTTNSTPFVYSTYTTVNIHDCCFIGKTVGTACSQDAIVLGGTLDTRLITLDDSFTGYGSVIVNNFFDRVRRTVYLCTAANGVIVRDNTIWSSCGSNLADGACMEIDNPGVGTKYTSGNIIAGNLFEMGNYKYSIKILRGAQNTLSFNNFFDITANNLGGVYLGAEAYNNFIIDGITTGLTNNVVVCEDGVTKMSNTHITANHLSESDNHVQTNFNHVNGTKTRKLVVTGSPTGSILVQPDSSQSDYSPMIELKRSAAESVSPNAVILNILQNGKISLTGGGAGNIDAPLVTFSGGGRKWSAVTADDTNGGAMEIDTGSSGSFLTVKGYGIKLVAEDGTTQRLLLGCGKNMIRFGSDTTVNNNQGIITGVGTPEGNITAPTGSLYLRSDGGAGTSLYVKESGVGATGWITK